MKRRTETGRGLGYKFLGGGECSDEAENEDIEGARIEIVRRRVQGYQESRSMGKNS